MTRWKLRAIALLGLALLCPVASSVDYSREIRPILSDKCFRCHGPDAESREAELRFDELDVAIEKGVIVPRDPGASLLVQRITAEDLRKRMPPPESNLALSDAEKAALIAWIEAGAPSERHWAFVRPGNVEVPESDSNWIRNPIDAFVLDRLQSENLAPSTEADRFTLLRRLSFDLTGLPPRPEDIEAFVNDTRPDAYERVLDRLLAEPAYGEQMAAHWLDVARYADTFGYQADRLNHVWPWRDWVIRAFNDNLPYDQFMEWQLAGDLLPNATQDQRLATAFNRLHRQTNEGGSVLEEFRTEYVVDRTNTFGTAFLGMTMECARCHDHKFDPISQRDFYALSSFFNNLDESGMYSHFTESIPSPSLLIEDEARKKKRRMLEMVVADRERALHDAKESGADRLRVWRRLTNIQTPEPDVYVSFDEIVRDQLPAKGAKNGAATLASDPQLVDGVSAKALEFSGDNGVDIARAGIVERTDSFSVALWMYAQTHANRAVIFHRSKAAEDAASRGYELLIEDGRLVFRMSHFWPGNALCVQAVDPLPLAEWKHVTVTYDGSSRANGVTLYVDGAAIATETIRDGLRKTIQYSPGSDEPSLGLAYRFRDSGFEGGRIDEFMVFHRALSAAEIAVMLGAEPKSVADEMIEAHYFARIDRETGQARDALHDARVNLAQHLDATEAIMTMSEMDAPRQAFRLDRGRYDRPAEAVEPNTPASILPFPDDLPRNRLGLAEWLTSKSNPLTARVAVNRYWQIFFGRGLVETQEDFGNQGTPPSHPELLDHLATWFFDSGWDVKALCRYIVSSATYRQSSAATPNQRERDPGNALLARGPKHRLRAEQIRDAALCASGLLAGHVGGPSVMPYEPPDIWREAASQAYKPDSGDGLYRRSMYTFWKRTVPPPSMLTFDAPSREYCLARRERTRTPLQALLLLNGTQYVEAARVLAESVLQESPEDCIVRVYRRLLGRDPDPDEARIVGAAYGDQLALYREDREAAKAVLTTGERAVAEGLDASEVAALTSVAQLLMNFDEFVMKQ